MMATAWFDPQEKKKRCLHLDQLVREGQCRSLETLHHFLTSHLQVLQQQDTQLKRHHDSKDEEMELMVEYPVIPIMKGGSTICNALV